MGELEVIGLAGMAEHDAGESLVILEASQDLEAEAIDIEGQQRIDIVRGPGDPERGRPDVIALGHQRVLHRPRTQPPVGGCEQHGQSGSLAMRTVRKAGANAS